jgi:hypothetical protein
MADPRPDVKGATPLEVQHITLECRTNWNLYPAWHRAVDELLQVYYAQVERDPDATISLAIYRTSGDRS